MSLAEWSELPRKPDLRPVAALVFKMGAQQRSELLLRARAGRFDHHPVEQVRA